MTMPMKYPPGLAYGTPIGESGKGLFIPLRGATMLVSLALIAACAAALAAFYF